MARRNVGAIPGVGKAAGRKPRKVKVKEHVRRAPYRPPAPDTSKARPIPKQRAAPKPSAKAKGIAAVPGVTVAARSRVPRKGEESPRPQGVSQHLLQHRINRGQAQLDQQDQRQLASNLEAKGLTPLSRRPPIKLPQGIGKGASLAGRHDPLGNLPIGTTNLGEMVRRSLVNASGEGEVGNITDSVHRWLENALPHSAGGPPTGPGAGAQVEFAGPQLGRSLKVATAGVKDAYDIPANAIPSAFKVITDPSGAWKGFKKTDPIALALQGKFAEAGKQAAQHPVATGLEVSGGVGAIGRAPTLAARTGVLGRGARGWSLGKRAPLEVPGYHVKVPRRYSPNVATRLMQERMDRGTGATAANLRRDLRHPLQAFKREIGAGEGPAPPRGREANRPEGPTVANERQANREVNRRADEFANTIDEGTRRMHRGETAKRVFHTIFPTRKARAGRVAGDPLRGGYEYRAAVERSARKPETLLADLRSHLHDLEAQHRSLVGVKEHDAALLNEELRGHISDAIKRVESGKSDPAQVFAAADQFIRDAQPVQDELVKQGLLDPVAAREAKLIPYAVRYKGAAFSRLPRMTPTGAQVRLAAGDVREATQRVETTRAQLAQAREKVRFEAGRKRQLGKNATPRQVDAAQARLMRAIEERDRIKANVGRHEEGLKITRLGFREAKGARRAAGEPMRQAPGMVLPTEAIPEALRGTLPEELRTMRRSERQAANDPSLAPELRGAARRRVEELRNAELRGWKPMDPAEIERELHDTGTGMPGYLTQRPGGWDASAYHIPSVEPPAMRGQVRTGQATRLGTYSGEGVRALTEEALHGQALIDATDTYRKRLGMFAVRDPNGKGEVWRSSTTQTRGSFEQAIRAHEAEHGLPSGFFRVVRETPMGANRLQMDLAKMHTDEHAMALGEVDPSDVAAAEMIRESLAGGGAPTDTGPFVAIPDAVAKRAIEHLEVSGVIGPKAFQKFVNLWRTNVLVFSPKWATGNVLEAGLRSTIAGAGPRSWDTGRRIRAARREIAPGRASDVEQLAEGGRLLYGSSQRELYRGARAWQNTALAPVAKRLEAFWRKPAPATLARAYHGYANAVKTGMRHVEQQFQIAAAGKYALSHQIADPYFLRVSDQAIHDAALGQLATEAQVEMGRFVRKVFGNYEVFPPWLRGVFATYTPFAPWFINALRFLYVTLPKDHPVLTGLIAASYQETEDWRKKYGLGYFLPVPIDSYLQGGVPSKELPSWAQAITGGSGISRLQHYTPFGAIAEGAEGAAGVFFPQGQNLLLALEGRDWRGEKIVGKSGKELDPVTSIGLALAESAAAGIPGLVPAQTIAQGGGTPAGTPWPIFGDTQGNKGVGAGLLKWGNVFKGVGGDIGQREARRRYTQLADFKNGALAQIRRNNPNYRDDPTYKRLNDERKRLEDKLGITAKRKKSRQTGGSSSTGQIDLTQGGGSGKPIDTTGQGGSLNGIDLTGGQAKARLGPGRITVPELGEGPRSHPRPRRAPPARGPVRERVGSGGAFPAAEGAAVAPERPLDLHLRVVYPPGPVPRRAQRRVRGRGRMKPPRVLPYR